MGQCELHSVRYYLKRDLTVPEWLQALMQGWSVQILLLHNAIANCLCVINIIVSVGWTQATMPIVNFKNIVLVTSLEIHVCLHD